MESKYLARLAFLTEDNYLKIHPSCFMYQQFTLFYYYAFHVAVVSWLI